MLIDADTQKQRVVSKQLLRVRIRFTGSTRRHIYTNDGSRFSPTLSRESSQRTATEVEQELGVRWGRPSEEEQGHSLGIGLA